MILKSFIVLCSGAFPKGQQIGLKLTFENDEWVSVENLEAAKSKYREIARKTIQKNKRINIRISEKDLNGIKLKALEDGMPYQTLISSIIHKYIAGKLVEKA